MAVIAGTIKGIHLLNKGKALNGVSEEETYLVTADFAAYDASADTAQLADVGAAITARVRDGGTRTLRAAHGAGAGKSDGGVAIYYGAMTVSTDALTFSLTEVDRSTEVGDFTTAAGVPCVVTCTVA
jgi:hypothetical protein